MKALPTNRRMGALRLKQAALAAIDARIKACRQAEARYASMSRLPDGGSLGSVQLALTSEATERSARMEAELIRRYVAALPASGEAQAEPRDHA